MLRRSHRSLNGRLGRWVGIVIEGFSTGCSRIQVLSERSQTSQLSISAMIAISDRLDNRRL